MATLPYRRSLHCGLSSAAVLSNARAYLDLLWANHEALLGTPLGPDQCLTREERCEMSLLDTVQRGKRTLEVLQPLRRSHSVQEKNRGELNYSTGDRERILACDDYGRRLMAHFTDCLDNMADE